MTGPEMVEDMAVDYDATREGELTDRQWYDTEADRNPQEEETEDYDTESEGGDDDYAARAAAKLRRENRRCLYVSVFIRTNPFRTQDRQYRNSGTTRLIAPTSDTRDIIQNSRKSGISGFTAHGQK